VINNSSTGSILSNYDIDLHKKEKSMKYLLIIAIMIASLYAVDFTNMSTEDMMQMRGNVPVDQRDDFRQEMHKRMQSMTPQERQQYGMQGQGMMGMGNQGMMGGKGMMGMGNQGMMGGQGMMGMGNQGMMGGQGMNCCCCCCCCQAMMKNRCMKGNKGMGNQGGMMGDQGMMGGQGMKEGQGMMMNNQ